MKIDKALQVVQAMGRKRHARTTARLARPKPAIPLYAAPVRNPWTWETGTPKERADLVRSTSDITGISTDDICDLFDLSYKGLADILRGRDWQREHSRSPAFME